MEQITSLIAQLTKDSTSHPFYLDAPAFQSAHQFGWDYARHTISYDPSDEQACAYLLHEYGHATLKHSNRSRDITLLEMERAAWDQASRIAPNYGVAVPDEIIEASLDTYRDWLHARSACPTCGAAGVQTQASAYRCLACETTWRVNDARTCALRRYQTK